MVWLMVVFLELALLLCSSEAADKTISVTADGINAQDCWNGSQPCRTLDFALGGLESGTTILVSHSHNFSNDTWANVSTSMTGVTLCGLGQPQITCPSGGFGVAFWDQSNVTVSGIQWRGCSLRTPTTDFVNDARLQANRSLFFYNVTDLLVEDCTFSSQGRGGGVALYNVAGSVQFKNSHFVDNTIDESLCAESPGSLANCALGGGGGLYIEMMECANFAKDCNVFEYGISNCTYIVDNCTFSNNVNGLLSNVTSENRVRAFGNGGGLALLVLGKGRMNEFKISRSQFENNTALRGGGLFVFFASDTSGNAVTIDGAEFFGNLAHTSLGYGGGMTLAMLVPNRDLHPLNSFLFQNMTMVENYAEWGGGVTVLFGNESHTLNGTNYHSLNLSFVNCQWHSNTAVRAGAAVAVFHLVPIDSVIVTTTNFTDAKFVDNLIPRVGGRTERYGYGTLYSLSAPLFFNGSTLFANSTGSALVISASKAHFAGDVEFYNNHGFVGSAIYLLDISAIYVYSGLNLRFIHNDAFDTGGAIHYVYPGAREDGNCLFHYHDHSVPPSKWDVNISFSENQALYGGSAIFLGDPSGCHWPDNEFLFDVNKTHPLDFTGNDPKIYGPILGTPAINLTFGSPVDYTDGYYWIQVRPGEVLNIPVNVVDYFNSSTVTVTLDTKCYNYSLFVENEFFSDLCGPGTAITYNGPRVFVANDSITGIKLGGPQNNTDLVLLLKSVTIQSQAIVSVLRVLFSECSYGYHFDEDTKSCNCYDNGEAVECFNFNGTDKPCILSGYWFGTIETKDGSSHAMAACTHDACKLSCNESCLDLIGWCKLPEHDYDLCNSNHGGPLCAYCLDGYSPNYGHLHCVADDQCTVSASLLQVLLMSVFWLVIIVTLLLVLRLNLRLGSGYMYGFIYYFSVLPFISGNIVQNRSFSNFLSVFTSFVHLDPHFLSFFKLCFAKGISPVQLEFFHYFHPVLVTAVVYVVILINRYCPKLPVLSVKTPVHALCLILLLTYTSLFQTSFAILEPIQFFHSNPETSELFVKLQPLTLYFDLKDHLPYALVALVVELVLVLPVTIIMLLAPYLMCWKVTTKFKPILDEFQACYSDRYRWFAGYYLLCRQLIALPPLFINTPSGSIFVQQILNVIILLIHAYIQPYRERWLNLLDTFFLLDLTLVSILSGDTAQNVFSDALYKFRIGLKITLITVPCLYLFLVGLVVIGLKFRKWYQTKHPSTPPPATSGSPPVEEYEVIPDDGRNRRHQHTVSVVSINPFNSELHEDNPLLQHAEMETEIPEPSPPDTQQSDTRTSILRRMTTGISSHVNYWRNTSLRSFSQSRPSEENSLPELREQDEF